MLEEAKRLCRKSATTRILVLAVIIAAGMLVPMLAPVNYLLGPKKISGENNLNYSSYKNKYVEFDVQYALSCYVETTSTTKQNNRVISSKKVSYGYIVYNYEDNSCFAVELPTSKNDKVNDKMLDIMEETVQYYYAGTKPTKDILVKGTIKPLTGQELKYYKESLAELKALFPEIENVAVEFKLVAGEVNGVKTSYVFLIYGVAGILLIVILYTLIRMKTGADTAKLRRFVTDNPGVTQEQIESDMNSAVRINKNIWAGRRFTVWRVGMSLHILNNKDLVWAYYFRRTGRNAVSQTRTFHKTHRMVAINMSQEESEKLLQTYIDTQPQMVIGYTKELEKQYNKDFAGFLNLRYHPAQNNVQDDPYRDFYGEQFRAEDFETTKDVRTTEETTDPSDQ